MDLAYALTYVFEDRQWVYKLVLLVVTGVLALVPLIGLLALAVALGYLLQIADNVRNGLPRPLPDWDDYADKFSLGLPLLAAMIVYHLPLLVANSATILLASSFGAGLFGGLLGAMVACCVLPVSLLYLAVIYPLLAIGAAEYIETKQARRLFEALRLFEVLRDHARISIQWIMAGTLVNGVALLIGWVPCIGQLVVLGLVLPVHGHLLGQYARQLELPPRARVR